MKIYMFDVRRGKLIDKSSFNQLQIFITWNEKGENYHRNLCLNDKSSN